MGYNGLVPGKLGALKEFISHFKETDIDKLKILNDKIFKKNEALPAFGIRRMKSEAIDDLNIKKYKKYACQMPEIQAEAYKQILLELRKMKGGKGLKLINYLRSVSLHPEKLELAHKEPGGFIDFVCKSARIKKSLEILEEIEKKGEKALVFLETREMQYLLQNVFCEKFNLEKVDIINGSTSVPQRASIVKKFQDGINDSQFEILILSPKAAGVGLTLTAATHVIHLSRWWNPAVEEQCNDRVYRIGQTKDVSIQPGYSSRI